METSDSGHGMRTSYGNGTSNGPRCRHPEDKTEIDVHNASVLTGLPALQRSVSCGRTDGIIVAQLAAAWA
jgi:hypothetical protein